MKQMAEPKDPSSSLHREILINRWTKDTGRNRVASYLIGTPEHTHLETKPKNVTSIKKSKQQ
jgi:hypothetical protein